jgi:large repetitive protein
VERLRHAPGPLGLRGHLARAVGCATAAAVLLLGAPGPVAAAPTPTVTITDVTVVEGSSGSTAAIFTIKAAPRPRNCCPLSVTWTTANGTATSPADYADSSGVVTLTRATSSRTVSVPVVTDAIDEPAETFVVNLSNLVGSPGTIGDAQGVASITDDDAAPSLTIDDLTVPEGDVGSSTADLALALSGPSGFDVSVAWATVAGSATAGADYVSSSGTATIPAGSTAGTVSVDVLADTTDEAAETFTVSLSAPTNATIADDTGTVTITDDDPLPVLTIDDRSGAEGDAGTSTMTFTVALTPASGRTVTVDWTTSDGSATQPGDYQPASGTLTFAAGDTSETLDVTVNGDVVPELDETFAVVLSNPVRATVGTGTGTGTIVDDEVASVIDIAEPTLAEGDAGASTMAFEVTLSNPSAVPVTVDWATASGTATGGVDFTSATGTVSFAPFDVTEEIQVAIDGDLTYEPDETFAVDLENATNATIGDPQGVGTIANDDPVPALSVANVAADEGDAGSTTFTFTVSLDRASGVDAAVDYTTTPDSATEGADYADSSGTLVIPAGDPSGTIDVTVFGDALHEDPERFDLELSAPSSATIDDGAARGTIANDDPLPTLSIGDATVTEGTGTAKNIIFTVSLSEESGLPATVDWSTADGTARGPADYAASGGTLTFPPGTTSRTISVKVKGDRVDERRETFTVNLVDPVGATIVDGVGVGRIGDNDKTPTTLTLQVLKGRMAVKAKGLLEPSRTGFRVAVALFRKTPNGFAKIATVSAPARYIRDRDHDGLKEGIYLARFARPRAGGTYRFVASFAGSSTHRPSKRTVDFTLTAS